MSRHVTPAAVTQASTQLQAQVKALNATPNHQRPALDLSALEAAARARLHAHINASARLHSADLSQQFRVLRAQAQARLNTIGSRHLHAHRVATLRALVQPWITP